jgi:predicted GH43/DUF377 family glycosyl hydrolase
LLRVGDGQQNGDVPNVVYSCGAVIHDGLLWLSYGIGDAKVGGGVGVGRRTAGRDDTRHPVTTRS